MSLAHHGVLFLDEVCAFAPSVLDALRQPLEEGRIDVTRAMMSARFPARPLLVCAGNPCPCGFDGDPVRRCVCPPGRAEAYRARLSGPVADRIDLHVEVPAARARRAHGAARPAEPSAVVRERVAAARARAQARGQAAAQRRARPGRGRARPRPSTAGGADAARRAPWTAWGCRRAPTTGSCGWPGRSPTSPARSGVAADHLAEALGYRERRSPPARRREPARRPTGRSGSRGSRTRSGATCSARRGRRAARGPSGAAAARPPRARRCACGGRRAGARPTGPARAIDAPADAGAWPTRGSSHVGPPEDPAYPGGLRQLPDPPFGLFLTRPGRRGARAARRGPGRGHRGQPPRDGGGPRARARRGRAAWPERGAVVVSGLAHGIDAAAHEGALAAGGVTVAVLGCGVDVPYPRRNRVLAARSRHRGALVSEYWPGTPPAPWRFPARKIRDADVVGLPCKSRGRGGQPAPLAPSS